MLERRIVPQEAMYGMGYLSCGATAPKTGGWGMISGSFSTVAGPTGREGKPGYAKSGDVRIIALKGSSAAFVSGVQTDYSAQLGMLDKLHFQREDSDLTLDTLVSGAGVLFITKGLVDTDQYASDFFAGTVAIGTKLYIDTNGVLNTGTITDQTLLKPRAVYMGTRNGANAATFDSNYVSTGYIAVQILGLQ